MKIDIGGFVVFLVIVGLAMLAMGCSKRPLLKATQEQLNLARHEAERKRCCPQCLKGSSRDPSGYDIRLKQCWRYESDGVLDKHCAGFFRTSGKYLTVGLCQR